ncbi:MAG: hypothetical protein HWD58_14365 [Bacteroidota bacterium]|nr:MAG: hypothetical protein HWD58_14365 [Bacteroidota bacterium]
MKLQVLQERLVAKGTASASAETAPSDAAASAPSCQKQSGNKACCQKKHADAAPASGSAAPTR